MNEPKYITLQRPHMPVPEIRRYAATLDEDSYHWAAELLRELAYAIVRDDAYTEAEAKIEADRQASTTTKSKFTFPEGQVFLDDKPLGTHTVEFTVTHTQGFEELRKGLKGDDE